LGEDRLFDIALCNAVGAYRDARSPRDRDRLDDFLHDLTWCVSCSLLGVRLHDTSGEFWRVEDGTYLSSWLRRQRGRWHRWLRGEIQLESTAPRVSALQAQRILRDRIVTTDVSLLLVGARDGRA
jgi:cytochrome P450